MPQTPTSFAHWLRDPRVQRRAALLVFAMIALVIQGFTGSELPAADASGKARTEATTPRRKPAATKPAVVATTAAADTLSVDVFRGLGAWVDLFDVDLPISSYIAKMKANGVQTLYIQTGRSNTDTQIDPRVGPWLAAAHEAGIKVVGWYLPMYATPQRDLIRTVAIANYRYGEHRFDALGVDIEYRAAVDGLTRWNRRVAANLAAVRRALGPDYPIASIPPTPLQMNVAPDYWAGFPWRALGEHTDAILLMSYWSDRIGCPQIRIHCAYEFTARNVEITRQLIGRDDRIIHVIGGVGDSIDASEVRDFVRGALDSAADGASIYDARTTQAPWWSQLSQLKRLGR